MDLFPPIEPHASGMLAVGDGHHVYWEVSGNPHGVPVLFVHGGPGAGTAPAYRRFFDPTYWRIVLFDQRGSGRSRPQASLSANTTQHLISDMEHLRAHLAIESWLLFGGSWGSTLALAYGQAYPDRVLGFVLRGVFLFRPSEIEWFMNGMGMFFPDAHRRFIDHVRDDDGDILTAYGRRLADDDPSVAIAAARTWCGYEDACARLVPRPPAETQVVDAGLALSLARIECHYMRHAGFLRPNQLLEGMARIRHLPAAIVQGRYDMVCPPTTACELAQAWPSAMLTIVPDAGHSAMETGTRTALVAAVDRFRREMSLTRYSQFI